MTEAEILFNRTFARIIFSYSVVNTFRQVFVDGITGAARKSLDAMGKLYDEVEKLEREMGFEDNGKAVAKLVPRDAILVDLATQQVSIAVNVAAAAALVFAHSILDGAAFDCCKAAALHAPTDWETDLRERKVRLVDVKTQDYSRLLADKLADYLEDLEKDGLLAKIDRLHARCKPPPSWCPIPNYTFNLQRITRLDNLRHEIVHGERLGKDIQDAAGESDYLLHTARYLTLLVREKYGFPVDPAYVSRQLQSWQRHS